MNVFFTHKNNNLKKKKYVYVERSGGGAGVAEGTQMTAVWVYKVLIMFVWSVIDDVSIF